MAQRYVLHAWVIMPNHVHVLFAPTEGWTLAKILHSWKSFSAREANKVLDRTGEFWQPEYFDRAIRDGKGYIAAVKYIELNPVSAAETPVVRNFAQSRLDRDLGA